MKILISSRLFYPSLGGSETNAEILAREFARLGHQVKLITNTPGTSIDAEGQCFPFEVIRQPNATHLLRLAQWCDVCLQNGIILKQAWVLLLTQTPWVIRHQTWIQHPNHSATWNTQLKLLMVKFATSISISKAIADHLNFPSTIIPNPYRDDLFRIIPNVPRTKELVYLGRLVSDKGVDLLLEAIATLQRHQLFPKLTIIGTGPEEAQLRQQAADLGIETQITFAGPQISEELVLLLNQHQIMVVPSLWHEPFGVVALEGIASGCVVVGSEGGGLKDAIGPCGVTFSNGDANALTQALANLLTDPEHLSHYREQAVAHLARHRKTEVAKTYLRVFEEAL